MTTQVRMPKTAEEVMRDVNDALGTTGYYPYYHYDRHIDQWGMIVLEPSKTRGDNPVDIRISIKPGAETFEVLKKVVDGYQWVVSNKLGEHKGEFTLVYEHGRAWLRTVAITYPPDTGDITSAYRVEKKSQ